MKSLRPAPARLLSVGLLALGLIASFAGCSRSAKPALIGQWQSTKDKDILEFRSDGTLHGTDRYGRPLNGSFEFVDADHVHLRQTVSSQDPKTGTKAVDNSDGVCKLQINGDTLTFTDPGGGTAAFRRLK